MDAGTEARMTRPLAVILVVGLLFACEHKHGSSAGADAGTTGAEAGPVTADAPVDAVDARPDAASDGANRCQGGATCSTNESCNVGCLDDSGITCSCSQGRFACQVWHEGPDAGVVHWPACPEPVQGAACTDPCFTLCEQRVDAQPPRLCVCLTSGIWACD
jgi:hypothetical protein